MTLPTGTNPISIGDIYNEQYGVYPSPGTNQGLKEWCEAVAADGNWTAPNVSGSAPYELDDFHGASYSAINDVTDAAVSINPILSGQNQTVTWTWNGSGGNTVHLEIWKDAWTWIEGHAAITGSDESYLFDTPIGDYPADDDYRIIVIGDVPGDQSAAQTALWEVYTTTTTGAPVNDVTNAQISIDPIIQGANQTVTWTWNGGATNVDIEIWKDAWTWIEGFSVLGSNQSKVFDIAPGDYPEDTDYRVVVISTVGAGGDGSAAQTSLWEVQTTGAPAGVIVDVALVNDNTVVAGVDSKAIEWDELAGANGHKVFAYCRDSDGNNLSAGIDMGIAPTAKGVTFNAAATAGWGEGTGNYAYVYCVNGDSDDSKDAGANGDYFDITTTTGAPVNDVTNVQISVDPITQGQNQTVTWTWNGGGTQVDIEIWKDAWTWIEGFVISGSSGSKVFDIAPGDYPADTDYRVVVYSSVARGGDGSAGQTSLWEVLTTTPPSWTITVISPNGGEKWYNGTEATITWSTSGSAVGFVQIVLYKGGGVYKLLTEPWGIPVALETFDWTPIGEEIRDDYMIKIISLADSNIFDFGDNHFEIYLEL